MRGIHHVIVQNRYLKYEFEIRRNITIIRGDSATGKTTLVNMIREHALNGEDSGVSISCDCPCRVVEGNTWQEQLEHIEDSLVFVDEGNRFIASREFARAVQKGDNYYILITREGLEALPYSVREIYGIKSSGKYGILAAVYHQLYMIYGDFTKEGCMPRNVLVEDSNSGYEFFKDVFEDRNIPCDSANGKSNIFHAVSGKDTDNMLVIADGAAFGSQIEKVARAIAGRNIQLFLPESFEWLLLSSQIFDDKRIRDMLANTSDAVDSRRYFSWERFFTHILVEETQGTYLAYNKQKLNPVYLHAKNKKMILEVINSSRLSVF